MNNFESLKFPSSKLIYPTLGLGVKILDSTNAG